MKRILYVWVAISVVLVIQSCRSTSEVSTDINGNMLDTDITEGKVIYTRDCARCHEQKKVDDYTAAQWENILIRMIIQAELDETQGRQVKAYIEWELVND